MFWKVFFYCDPIHAANLGSMLEGHVPAVSWFETKDPALWMVEFIFEEKPDHEKFAHLLSCACSALNIATPSFMVEKLPDTDWLEATWRSFPPQQIGRYYVYGSHISPTPPEGSIPLQINAATAFGSGEHETTTACLLTLDDLAKNGRLFQKPLDMGCGSGILAIAIAKTWSVSVIAADNDPESVRVTTHNSALNDCDSLLKACVSEGFENKEICAASPYDLIVANILATPLIKMAASISNALAPGGAVILSGLLTRHQEDVVKAYKTAGLRLVSHKTLNDWEALLLEKK
jgi:ribosomal protein L11 methyltransferase